LRREAERCNDPFARRLEILAEEFEQKAQELLREPLARRTASHPRAHDYQWRVITTPLSTSGKV
jgi:hypothetical protein